MKQRPPEPESAPEVDEAAELGFVRQLGQMRQALVGSPVVGRLVLLAVVMFVTLVATTYSQIRLNLWNKPFYDAISRRDVHDFLFQLGVFFVIAGALLILNVIQRWVVESLKIRLREGLVGNLLKLWMLPRRAFWLANAGGHMGVNPDQRMHEDARKLCELTADLGTGLLQSAMLFVTFAGVLWVLSNDFSFRIGDVDYAVPGFMLWAAVIYAGVGSLMSWWVGHSLVNRNAERYAREADLRFALVRINEHLDDISLAGGEADENRRVELHLTNVLAATRRLVLGLTNLTWVTAGFGWVTLVAPTLVAAPLYFSGKISFGGLMMAAAAFTQAQSSLRWFVDNFSVIADWRATLVRVAGFRYALAGAEVLNDYESRIAYAEGEPGTMTIEDLEVVSPGGRDALKEKKVVVRSGDRVLVMGAPGTSKTLLFRALAGLWPWGTGRVSRPKDEHIFFLPRGTPSLPRGTLREVIAYPQKVESFQEGDFTRALGRLGLERLVPLLDSTRRWDRELSQDEQLSLAFARILLQRPPWVMIDDTLGSLDDEALERVIDVFNSDLETTTVIHIGRAGQSREPLFTRVLHLTKAAPALAHAHGKKAAHSVAAVDRR
jgi:vitamin B12/bleomycin/antimicrobial peptide transport system ATP-binding/permease protein